MNELLTGFENVWAYIDDLLVLTKSLFEDHFVELNSVLKKLKGARLKINANKSFFAQEELEYLGYWITREGILPIKKKIEAILKIARPTSRKELRSFIGLINYYYDMWQRRSEILAPLTKLTSEKNKWLWNDNHQKSFEQIKKFSVERYF